MRALLRLVAAGTLMLAVAGCGGFGGGYTIEPTTARVGIAWPDVTGSPTGPASARSARIVLLQGSVRTGTSVGWVVDRPDAPAACVVTTSAPAKMYPDPSTLTVTFFAEKGATGEALCSASVNVKLERDGALTRSSGAGLGYVAPVGTVSSVRALSKQSVQVQETLDLSASGFDSKGSPIALAPGTVQWQLVSGSSLQLTPDGQATGLAPGTSTVTATVDGNTSPAVDVKVPEVSLYVSPSPAYVGLGATQEFAATVYGIDDTAVEWSVTEGSGGSVTTGGLYTAPSVPGLYHLVARVKAYPAASKAADVHVQ